MVLPQITEHLILSLATQNVISRRRLHSHLQHLHRLLFTVLHGSGVLFPLPLEIIDGPFSCHAGLKGGHLQVAAVGATLLIRPNACRLPPVEHLVVRVCPGILSGFHCPVQVCSLIYKVTLHGELAGFFGVGVGGIVLAVYDSQPLHLLKQFCITFWIQACDCDIRCL